MNPFDQQPKQQWFSDSDIEHMSGGYSYLVRKCWSHSQIGFHDVVTILEPGCGRGAMTLALLQNFSNATIYLIDYYLNLVPSVNKSKVHQKLGKFDNVFQKGTYSDLDLIVLSYLSDSHGIRATQIELLASYLRPNRHLLTIGDNGNLLSNPLIPKLFQITYQHGIMPEDGVLWSKK